MTRGFALKTGRFNREMKRRGLADSAALARAIGVNKSTAWRVLNGQSRPGPDFVNRVLEAWGLEFHDLFDDPRSKRSRIPAA